MVMSIKNLTLEVVKREAGKTSISIAQVAEVMRHLADLCTDKQNKKDFLEYIEYRRKTNWRKNVK